VHLHRLDFAEQFDEFVLGIIHEAAVAETQIAARQRSQRITERAAFEIQRFEERRQLVVIVNQPARRDARSGLNADRVEKFIRLFYFSADIRQAAVLLVLRDVVRVNGHDDAGQPVACKTAHVFVIPKAAVGADHRMDAALRRVARHGAQIAMHHRFATNEEQVADVIFQRDIHGLLRFVERDAAAGLGIKFRACKSAEVAIGVANVRDGKLQVAGAAVIQNFADEFERSPFGPRDGL